MAAARGSTSTRQATSPRLERIDVTYAAAGVSMAPDPFTIVAQTPSGDVTFPMRLVPTLDQFPGTSRCHWVPGVASSELPADLKVSCVDPEGDPLEAVITRLPDHGTALPPVVTPGRFGEQDVVTRYTANAGYLGIDYVGVTVNGQEILFKIDVFPPFPGGGAKPPEQRPTTMRPPPEPPEPAEQARKALGGGAVRLVRRVGTARIYAPQGRLRATVGRPALAVTCGARCGIEARPRVAGRSLGRQRQTLPAGEVGVLRLSRATARRLKGATAARVRFALRIRVDGWAARRVTVALRTRAAR